METKRLRRVLYKKFIPAQYYFKDGQPLEDIIEGTDCWSDYECTGVFHGWATGFFFDKDNEPITYTYGIVEDYSGVVVEVLPANIKFDI